MALETVTRDDLSFEKRVETTKRKIADCREYWRRLNIRQQKVGKFQPTTSEGNEAKEQRLKTLASWIENAQKDLGDLVAQLEVDELDLLTNVDQPDEPKVESVALLNVSEETNNWNKLALETSEKVRQGR